MEAKKESPTKIAFSDKEGSRLSLDWPGEEFCFTHHVGIYLPPNILSYSEGLT